MTQGEEIALPGASLAVRLGLSIPALVAVTNYVMVVLDLNLITYKFYLMQDLMDEQGLLVAWPFLAGSCALLGLTAAAAVTIFSPVCVGSGIPEVLSFLNGNASPGLFTKVSFVVRVLGVVLAQGAGYPIGREGPMVGIGGCIGFGVAAFFLNRYEREADQAARREGLAAGASSEQVTNTSNWYMALEEKITGMKRMGCAIGGAAGIATAFNAPIGGVLYMMEEMAVSSLTPELPKFMCTVLASIFGRLLLNVTSMDVHKLVIYTSGNANTLAWNWPDIPVFGVLAVFLGGCGAIFSKVLLTVWSCRKRFYVTRVPKKWQGWTKAFECFAYAALCNTVWCIIPSVFGCLDGSHSASGASGDSGGHRRLEAASTTQYTCDENHYNELATVLLNSAEGAVKHLFSRDVSVLGSGPLFVALVVYGTLAAGMPGLGIPMGTFVPNMLIGALVGRMAGEQVQGLFGFEFAPPGIYAAVGSAAMLAGFTHMTLGIVALLSEAINDFGVVAPLMLAAFIAHAASKKFGEHGYDECLIIRKGVAFLDAEMPHELDNIKLTAKSVAHHLHPDCRLTARAMVGDIKRALRHREVDFFPIVGDNGDTCTGLTTRGRLKAVLSAVKDNRSSGNYLQRIRNSFRGRKPSKESTDSLGTNHSTSTWDSSGSAISPTPPQDASEAYIGVVANEAVTERSNHRLTTECSSYSATSNVSGTSSDATCSTATKLWRRATQGVLTDVTTEIRMHVFYKAAFTKQARADNDEEIFQPHADDTNRLDMTLITDPVPCILYEETPVSRFYPIFKAGAPVAMVISRSGRFSGIVSRRGLIDAAARLHRGEPASKNGDVIPSVTLGVRRETPYMHGGASESEDNGGFSSMPESSGAEDAVPQQESQPQQPLQLPQSLQASPGVTPSQQPGHHATGSLRQLIAGNNLQCHGYRRSRTEGQAALPFAPPFALPPITASQAQDMFPYVEHLSRASLEMQLMQLWMELSAVQDRENNLSNRLAFCTKLLPRAEETGTTGGLQIHDHTLSSNATSRQTSHMADVDQMLAEHHPLNQQLPHPEQRPRSPSMPAAQQQQQLPPTQEQQQDTHALPSTQEQQQTQPTQPPSQGPAPTVFGAVFQTNLVVHT